MKLKFLLLACIFVNHVNAQPEKDLLLCEDINSLVEELEFMYGYDQILREYTLFKTFDKSETNRIENLPDNLKTIELDKRKFSSDYVTNMIWQKYINPKDAEHTERMIEIIKKYGFPSVKRIKKYYNKEFIDPEFNPYILLVHAPEKYWEELKILMALELEKGRIDKCTYGHLLWHATGRKSFKPMLDNGYVMTVENGQTRLKSTCQ